MCPVDSTQTHRAWLAGGINLAPLQIESLQLAGSLTDAVYLGMCRRIEVDGYAIGSLSYNDSVLGYHGTERSATSLHAILRELNGSMHQFFFCHSFNILD